MKVSIENALLNKITKAIEDSINDDEDFLETLNMWFGESTIGLAARAATDVIIAVSQFQEQAKIEGWLDEDNPSQTQR